jgi:hypothetical protein
MSSLESLNEFENDSLHYMSQVDRAFGQLMRILNDEDMGLFYSEVTGLAVELQKLGRQITEYANEKRTKIFEDIDREAGRGVRESGKSAVGRQSQYKNPTGINTSAQPVS